MKIDLDLAWRARIGDTSHVIEPKLFDLLTAIDRGGNLNYAASATAVSYRHAWGLMRDWEARLGQPLAELKRGRGSSLTAAGRALLEARSRALAVAQAALDSAAHEATSTLARSLAPRHGVLMLASSHSDQVAQVVDMLRTRGWQVELDMSGSEGALRRYQRGEVDVAGFHLPLGELGRSVAMLLSGLLNDERDDIYLLELRSLGLMSRVERKVDDIAALGEGRLRFVNRQPGSGTRLVFDALLGLRGIAPGAINGYHQEEYTHSAVAAMVASGDADCALGTASAAQRFKLAFVPLVQERFYLCVRRSVARELGPVLLDFAAGRLAQSARAPSAAECHPSVGLLRQLHNVWR